MPASWNPIAPLTEAIATTSDASSRGRYTGNSMLNPQLTRKTRMARVIAMNICFLER